MKKYQIIIINPLDSSIIKNELVECIEVFIEGDLILFMNCNKLVASYPSKTIIVKFVSEKSL